MRYCTLCQRYIDPTKKWSWAIFLLGFLTAGIVSLIYLIYYLIFAKKKYCPICKSKRITKYSPEDIESKKIEKQEKKEERREKRQEHIETAKEMLGKAKDKITEMVERDDEKIE